MSDTAIASVLIVENGTVTAIDADGATIVQSEQNVTAQAFVDVPTLVTSGSYTGDTPLFISNTAPSNPPSKYMWIQTGLGVGGQDYTIWIEDGS